MQKSSTGLGVGQGNWSRESIEELIRDRVRGLLEEVLEEEVEGALGAGRSCRGKDRLGYRHGSKPRSLTTSSGKVRLGVPRARLVRGDGEYEEWRSQMLPRYRRSTPEVEQAVLRVYLSGGNTRRIRGALQPLLKGAPLSKSAVSRLVGRLEESYRQWRQRDLAEEQIVYLYVDGIAVKVRCGGKVVSLPVLVALGVRVNGEKVLLALETAGAESAAGWQVLLEALVARNLGRPRLVISDGSTGLSKALRQTWPGVAQQRCTVHKLRNLKAKAPRHVHEALHEDYNRIVYASTEAAARKLREQFLAKWRKLCPSVASSLEEAGEELLTFFQFPASQHRSLRTTNGIERLNGEFRRRIKTQSSLPTEGAVLLLFFGLFASGQIRMHRIDGWQDMAEAQASAA